MGFVIQAKCAACGYESDTLTIGDGSHFIATCRACHSIVNPERIPFRFDVPPCPECGATLGRSAIINAGALRSNYEGDYITEHHCPRCDDGCLAFQRFMHFKMHVVDRCPNVDDRIHGRVFGDKVDVPGLWLTHGKTIVENVPQGARYQPLQPMDLLVTDVRRDGDDVVELRLRFIRYLDDCETN